MEMIRHPSPKLYLFPLYDSLFGAPLGYPLNQLILGLKWIVFKNKNKKLNKKRIIMFRSWWISPDKGNEQKKWKGIDHEKGIEEMKGRV